MTSKRAGLLIYKLYAVNPTDDETVVDARERIAEEAFAELEEENRAVLEHNTELTEQGQADSLIRAEAAEAEQDKTQKSLESSHVVILGVTKERDRLRVLVCGAIPYVKHCHNLYGSKNTRDWVEKAKAEVSGTMDVLKAALPLSAMGIEALEASGIPIGAAGVTQRQTDDEEGK